MFHIPSHWWHELRRIIRFGIIGFLSFLLFTGGYALLSRVLWVSGNRSLENFLAICVASIFNFLAHRRWTFGSEASSVPQLIRYVFVAASATALQSVLFWIGYYLLHLHDFVVIIAAAFLVPFYTYLLHRFFTFHQSHDKNTPPLAKELDRAQP